MRTILQIEKDLARCDKQLCATLESSSMTPEERKVTLAGFMEQKEKLKAELESQKELARRMAMGDKNIIPIKN